MRCWWLALCLGACFGVVAVVGCGRSGAASDAATDAAGGSAGGASGAAGVTGAAGRGGTGNAAGTGASGTTGAGGQGGATGGVGGATGGAGRGGGSGAGGRGGGAGSAGCIVPGVGQNCASTQVCVYPTCKPSGICNPIPLDCVANCCLGTPCTVDGAASAVRRSRVVRPQPIAPTFRPDAPARQPAAAYPPTSARTVSAVRASPRWVSFSARFRELSGGVGDPSGIRKCPRPYET